MEMQDIVMKLIGPVQPTGDHGADQKRLENMKMLTELTDQLLFEISMAATNENRAEASIKAIGVHARDFLSSVRSA